MFLLIRSSFKIALASIAVNKVRSALTMLGIIIGVSAVIVLVSVGSGLRATINKQFQGLGSNMIMVLPGKVDIAGGGFSSFMGVFNSKLTDEDVRVVRSFDEVYAVSSGLATFLPVVYKGESRVSEVAGTDQNFLKLYDWPVARGRFFNNSEVQSGIKVIVLGRAVEEKLFKNEDSLGKVVMVGTDRYKVIGIMSEKGGVMGTDSMDTHVFVPFSAAKRLTGKSNPQYIYFKVKDDKKINETVTAITAALLKRHNKDDFSVVNATDLIKSVESILGAVTVALGGIAAISLLVGGIGIMNIMLVTVTERTKEIGLRKALGARPRDILWQFLIEALVLSGVGGGIGVALGYLGSLGLGKILATEVTVWSVLLSFSVSAAVGIIFGIVPAYKASRLDPITALRYE